MRPIWTILISLALWACLLAGGTALVKAMKPYAVGGPTCQDGRCS